MRNKQSLLVFGLTTLFLLFLVFLGTRHYGGNVSTFLHMDVSFGMRNHVPHGLVLYKDAAYDGMLYYQVARDIPALFSGHKTSLDSPYRFQRILLPLFTYVISLGNERGFPLAIVLINIGAAIGSLALTRTLTKKWNLHTMAIILNPAILVGILFSLTEPLSLFFIIAFFCLWQKNDRQLDSACLAVLLLSLLSRETTVFLIGFLFLWYIWRLQWKEALLLCVPIGLFALWQYYLVLRLGSLPFQTGSHIITLPLKGPLAVLRWAFVDTGIKFFYRLSSIALLFFGGCLVLIVGQEWYRKRQKIGVFGFLLTGLTVIFLSMDPHMWGVITSIGRVVTPLYPVYVLYAAERDSWIERLASLALITVSIVAAIGIATVEHPFIISQTGLHMLTSTA